MFLPYDSTSKILSAQNWFRLVKHQSQPSQLQELRIGLCLLNSAGAQAHCYLHKILLFIPLVNIFHIDTTFAGLSWSFSAAAGICISFCTIISDGSLSLVTLFRKAGGSTPKITAPSFFKDVQVKVLALEINKVREVT